MKIIFEKRVSLLGKLFSVFDLLILGAFAYTVLTIPVNQWIGFVMLIIAVIFHEVAHGLMAYFLGDSTAKTQGRLSLNPLVHIDPLGTVILPLILVLSGTSFLFGWAKPVPVIPRYFKHEIIGMMWVAIAGPATNLILAFSASQLIKILLKNQIVGIDHIVIEGLFSAIIINLVLAIFNMIPIPPLDGSRVIMVVLPDFLKRFWLQLEHYGLYIVMGLVYLGAFNSLLQRSIKISVEWLLQ
jgi:Zn-dependent protease